MGFGAAVLGGALISADSASSAAETQADAANNAANLQKQIFDKQVELQKPWLEAGTGALDQLKSLLAPGSYFQQPFTMDMAQNMPAMQFAQQQGMDAIQNSAAAKGGLLSTNAMRDIMKFGQQNAAQYENQAFNQWTAQRNSLLNPIQSLAGIGQSSTNQVSGDLANMGSSVGNLMVGAGNAAAAGRVGVGNALSNGLGQYSMYRNLFGSNAGGGGGGGMGMDWGMGGEVASNGVGPTVYGDNPWGPVGP